MIRKNKNLILIPILILSVYLFIYSSLTFIKRPKNIFEAIKSGDIESVEKYITLSNYKTRNPTTETLLTYALRLHIFKGRRGHTFTQEESEKIENEIYELIKLLVEKAGADVNKLNTRYESPLLLAVHYRYYNVAKLLLHHGAETDVIVTMQKLPLLYWALVCNTEEKPFFDLLVSNGANVNIQDDKGDGLLHLAIKKEFYIADIKKILETTIDINIRNKKGQTALDIAKEEGHTEIINLLMKHGAK